MFPGLIVLVALVGLFGQYPGTTDTLLEIVAELAPSSAVETLRGPLEGVVSNKGSAGALLGFGLLTMLWTASGYLGAFMRAAGAVRNSKEARPFYVQRPLQLAVTLAATIVVALVLVSLAITGPVAQSVGDAVGLGSTVVTLWSVIKWPLLLLIASLTIAALYHLAPGGRRERFRLVTPGSFAAVVVWVVASALFTIYVANFGSYNEAYGSLGAVVVFLLWAYIANNALLFGAQLDTVLERERSRAAGHVQR